MFFILKIMVIILISKTCAYITQDKEIILLPILNPIEAKEISLTLKVFGKLMQLNLHRNDQIISPASKVWKNNTKGATEKLSEFYLYIYKDHVSSSAIKFYQGHGWKGHIFMQNDLLEIRPLRDTFASFASISDFSVRDQINVSYGQFHLIKRSLQYFAGSDHNHLHKIRSKRYYDDEITNKPADFTIELAIFLDYETCQKFISYMQNENNLRNMMNIFVSYIQAFFHHSSLGVRIDIDLVHLEFMHTQLSNWSTYSDNSSAVLRSFCEYANLKSLSTSEENWDICLYISEMHFTETWYSMHDTRTNPQYRKVRGKSYFNGTCDPRLSCAIIQFPVSDLDNYGMMSSLRAVHEIGCLLGLENIPYQEGNMYVMYPEMFPEIEDYRNKIREITWSPLSRNRIKTLLKEKSCFQNYNRYKWMMKAGYYVDYSFCNGLSGRKHSAKAQCELFFGDKDANVVTLHDICRNLQCETPHKNKSYFTGRALNGTYCALERECCDGKCMRVTKLPHMFEKKTNCSEDIWSEWKEDSCKSSCLDNSKGVLVKRRFCKHGTQRTANCTGLYYDVDLCDDSLLCTEKRMTIAQFTNIKCTEFSKVARNTNMTIELQEESGTQMPHDFEKPWRACTVFCRRKDISDWYSPREEMLDYGVDPHFPDGTWCHYNYNEKLKYFCRQHYCLPENYSFEESEDLKNKC